jgi:hypothetical protein
VGVRACLRAVRGAGGGVTWRSADEAGRRASLIPEDSRVTVAWEKEQGGSAITCRLQQQLLPPPVRLLVRTMLPVCRNVRGAAVPGTCLPLTLALPNLITGAKALPTRSSALAA